LSSLRAERVGRGTMRSIVEGLTAPGPSTTLRVVRLPIAFGDRED
jgi:hypothetical protein